MALIKLTNSKLTAIVDKKYAKQVQQHNKWYLERASGFAYSTVNSERALHSFILKLEGRFVPRAKIYHVNGNKLDNRSHNLQFVRSSRYIGVTLISPGKWRTQTRIKGKQRFIGYFSDEKSAGIAYNDFLRKLRIPEDEKIYNDIS
jgi:hypothetical protein